MAYAVLLRSGTRPVIIGHWLRTSTFTNDSSTVTGIGDVKLRPLQERSQHSRAAAVRRLLTLDSLVKQLVQLLKCTVLHRHPKKLNVKS